MSKKSEHHNKAPNKKSGVRQHHSGDNREKMEKKYGQEVEHKHNKDHLEYHLKEKSHPHTQHGGDPSHNKHQAKSGSSKRHDHKKHTREHHKPDN